MITIPQTTKRQKEIAKHIQAVYKKLINSKGGLYDRAYKKYAYLKNDTLAMTDGNMACVFTLEFETHETSFVSLAVVGKELVLIKQDIEDEYPELNNLLKAENEICFQEETDSIISAYCRLIQAMSSDTTIGCIDLEYFKLIPLFSQVLSDIPARTKETCEYPVVFRAENFQAVIMPISVKI